MGAERPAPSVKGLIDRRSLRLYFIEKRRPHVPLFAGPLTAWPRWYLRDAEQIDAALAYAAEDRALSEKQLRVSAELMRLHG